jgi:potassium/hydrogen antiporter
VAVGALVGWLGVVAFRRLRLATEGLYPVASLAIAGIAYGLADSLHGSGFLSVYLAGLALGSAPIPAKLSITAFHEGLAWIAQVAMFLTLGLLVFPGQLDEVALEGAALALVLMFFARPLAAAIAGLPGRYSAPETVVLGWAGLRGALPVVLATFPVIADVPRSLEFLNIVFFVVLLSTLLDAGAIRRLGADTLEHSVSAEDALVGAHVRDLNLPRDALVSLIVRDSGAVAPRGSTRIRAGDRLQILIPHELVRHLVALSERWRSGPIGPAARPPARPRGSPPLFAVRPWKSADGDSAAPDALLGQPVVARIRERRDAPGALVLLADGRYAVTGELLAVGSRRALIGWARRRIQLAEGDERSWLQGVIGSLASDPGLQSG